jgi:hypothetical protein
MARKKPSKFSFFIALFMLVGQIAASSFMACPDMTLMSNTAKTAMEDHCAGMAMGDSSQIPSSLSSQASTPSDNVQSSSHCNLMCQYCRVNTMDVTDLFPLNAPPPRTWANALSVSPPATQLIDNHFRPPAIA